MSDSTILQRFRLFLLGLAAFLCVGTVVELLFTNHTEEPIQLLPFALCAAGLVVIVLALLRPRQATLLWLRGVMVGVGLGGFLGVYEHIAGNIAFALEIQPNAALGEVFWEALRGGNPLLAPGVLGITAVLALAATYYHPALVRP